MANFQVKNNTAGKIVVCGEIINGNATNTIAVATLYQIPGADNRLADMYNAGTVDIILPTYGTQKYSIEETEALNWLYNTFSRALATTTTEELHVYADGTSGDDSNNGFSATTPKKTLQAVFGLVPDIVKHNTTVHLSGTFNLTSSVTLGCYLRDPAYLLIDGGSSVSVVDDNSGNNYVADIATATSIGKTGSGWTIDEFSGYWVEVLDGDQAGAIFAVQSNTADTIYPVYAWSSAPTGATFRIVKPGTAIIGSSNPSFYIDGSSVGFYIQTLLLTTSSFNCLTERCRSITFHGVVIDGTNTNAIFSSSLGAGADGRLSTSQQRIDAQTFSFLSSEKRRLGLTVVGSDKPVKIYGKNHFQFQASILKTLEASGITNMQESFWYGTRVTKCTLMSCRELANDSISGNAKGNSNVKVKFGGGGAPGLTLINSSFRVNDYVDISGCTGHAIVCSRSTLRIITTSGAAVLTGTGSSGAGVYAHSGSLVHIKDGSAPTITGTVGDLSFDGSSQKSTWAAIDAGTPAVETTVDFVLAREV